MTALDLIKKWEGCKLTAYKCSAGVWTCGFGATGADVKEGTVWTQKQADDRLAKDLAKFQNGVSDLFSPGKPTSNQLAALTSFAFNVGLGALKSSTLLKKLKSGDAQGAADEFLKWNKAGGKVVAGLTRRREDERKVFLSAPTK